MTWRKVSEWCIQYGDADAYVGRYMVYDQPRYIAWNGRQQIGVTNDAESAKRLVASVLGGKTPPATVREPGRVARLGSGAGLRGASQAAGE